MAKEQWLKARLRERDWDIMAELDRRQLTYGEMADIVRDGVRRVLFDRDDPGRIDRLIEELRREVLGESKSD
ncbi:hypothetical protein [Desulfitobacterium hafniense]|uniref:hypothetical protein n=1 Tax=Desulfitobacterium hafniense TaxID=49338 RepID=UPI00059C1BA4|nr:hypothetical protein [Desulfitobacterium hafniense]